VGFWAKLFVLQAALATGYVWLVVTAVLFSVIGAFYYLRVVKLVYFDAPTDTHAIEPYADVRAVMSLNGLAIIVLGLTPAALLALCQRAIQLSL
jgi:NADH-quinone oxidoreductase subunit N